MEALDEIGQYVAKHLHEGLTAGNIWCELNKPGTSPLYPTAWIITGPPGWDRLLAVVDDLTIKWGHVPYDDVRRAKLGAQNGVTKTVDLADPESFDKLDKLVKETVFAIKMGRLVGR